MPISRWICGLVAILMLFAASAPQAMQSHDHSQHEQSMPEQSLQETTPAERQLSDEAKVEYVCPMHSHIVRDEPGTCPICGMDLEPQRPTQEIDVVVSAQMQQNLGVTTAVVEPTTLWRYYPTLATVQWNDNARWHIHPRAAGWLEELHVRSEGQQVNVGDKLYSIYSKELVVAQQDFLQALDAASSLAPAQAQRLLRDGRLRLELLGLTAEQIKQLEASQEIMYRVPVYAAHAGVVTTLNVAQGMYVEPATELLTITGADGAWLIADVPERYSSWLEPNAFVDVTLPQAGLDGYETRIDYIYPELDPQSRTQRVRIQLPQNITGAGLQVGMQAQVELYGGPKRDVLAVPLSALILTGSDNRVVVQTADNSFQQRAVHVGLIVGDQAEILHGLEQGERVVTSGQFLLDSEASLKASRLGGGTAQEGSGHAH